MASTLLAVDDSVTMRKVLEITFGGTDLKVITANTSDAALQQLKASKPDLVISDITLEGKNGYELCKAIKQQAPGTQVLLLSSKQNPYDAAKGSEAKADDHMDKPFDTQQMIDKVKKMLSGTSAGVAAPAQAAQAAPAAAAPMNRTSPGQAPQPSTSPQAPVIPAATTSTATRAKTLLYDPSKPNAGIPPMGVPVAPQPSPSRPQQAAPKAAEPAPTAQAATPATGVPYTRSLTAQSPVAVMPAPAATIPGGATAVHVNGHMASKLEGLGLTPAQVDAVLALSREVVERVVWEVVPVLAETLIKEEIARITK